MNSIAQYMPETPTRNSTQNLSTGADSNESNSQSCTVVNLSSSQGHLEGDSISLQELRADSENHASSASLRSVSSQGYMSPYEQRRSYTHQVVVVAPITGKLFSLLIYFRSRLFEGWIKLSFGKFAIQWISVRKVEHAIRWIVIYPVDSVIHLLNNVSGSEGGFI